MGVFPDDIFTEPSDVDPNTLANLGPLRRLAGTWEGDRGVDLDLKGNGPERTSYGERIQMSPIDPQANGPQLFYGLRYHAHVRIPGGAATLHDQVGYWLWEPATGLILQSVASPRGQVAIAAGQAFSDTKKLTLAARRGQTEYGICSTTFLERAFRAESYSIEVTFNPDGSWSYVSDTLIAVRGRAELFRRRDANTLFKAAEPQPNPLAQVTG